MMADIIYENNNYRVEVGPSMILEDARVYLAINKRTGVAEAEDSMLPKIIDYAIQLDMKLGEIIEEIELFPGQDLPH